MIRGTIKVLNLVNFGIGQVVWAITDCDIEAIDIETDSEFKINSTCAEKVILSGVWYGIKDEQWVHVYDVRSVFNYKTYQANDVYYNEYMLDLCFK